MMGRQVFPLSSSSSSLSPFSVDGVVDLQIEFVSSSSSCSGDNEEAISIKREGEEMDGGSDSSPSAVLLFSLDLLDFTGTVRVVGRRRRTVGSGATTTATGRRQKKNGSHYSEEAKKKGASSWEELALMEDTSSGVADVSRRRRREIEEEQLSSDLVSSVSDSVGEQESFCTAAAAASEEEEHQQQHWGERSSDDYDDEDPAGSRRRRASPTMTTKKEEGEGGTFLTVSTLAKGITNLTTAASPPRPHPPPGEAGAYLTVSALSSVIGSNDQKQDSLDRLRRKKKAAPSREEDGGGGGSGSSSSSSSSSGEDHIASGRDATATTTGNSNNNNNWNLFRNATRFVGLQQKIRHGNAAAEEEQGSEGKNLDDGDGETTAPGMTTSPSSPSSSKKNVGGWSVLFQLQNMKKHVPAEVQSRRRRRRRRLMNKNVSSSSLTTTAASPGSSSSVLMMNGASPLLPPATKLHRLCAEPDVTLQALEDALAAEPQAASTKDSCGQLPLHILGDNNALVSNPQGMYVATTFCLELMRAYPQAITEQDESGLMPFVCLVDDWVVWVYETHKKKTRGGLGAQLAELAGGLQSSIVSDDTSRRRSMHMHPEVEVWEEVQWCLAMLSLGMDELTREPHLRRLAGFRRSNVQREVLAKHLCQEIPALLKTILLIEQDAGEVRNRLLKMSIVRRLLLCPESVSSWLTSMLRKKGIPPKRAVDYLELVSSLTPEDYIGSFRTILPEDVARFEEQLIEVFHAIERLGDLMGSLVVLDMNEIERAASLPVIWYLMSRNLSRPFVVGLILIDFVLHLTLLLAYRAEVRIQRDVDSVLDTVPYQVVIFICVHYLIRKFAEALALLNISVEVFRVYFLKIWTLFDVATIILTVAGVVWNERHKGEYRNGFNALVVGLLWLKVLGFLKVINKRMAIFILALGEILFDVRYFAVVLIVILIMFADMMNIVISTKDDGDYCIDNYEELSGPAQDFCNPLAKYSYLRVYALLLGDFELDDYRETKGMTVLFVFFTLIGVIILLNVLIAVISDSYERANMRSTKLFGRARVAFVAQNEALETFLRPFASPDLGRILRPFINPTADSLRWTQRRRSAVILFGRVFRWVVLLSLLVTALDAEIYLVGKAIEHGKNQDSFFTLVCVAFLAIILACALWIVVMFAMEGFIRACFPVLAIRFFEKDAWMSIVVRKIARRLFGLESEADIFAQVDDQAEEEWEGRLTYLEKSFERSLQKVTEDITDEIKALEKRLYESQVLEGNDLR